MSSLRALVRAVLLEDDETLKKWALVDGNPVERALAKKGIVPIQRGEDQTSQLGAGMYNVVLDVVYAGKRAVARFSPDIDELNKLTNFVGHAKSLPTKYHKHFPKIYTTFDLEVELDDDNLEYLYGAVVEILDPLPPGLEFDLDYQSFKGQLQRARVTALMASDWVIEGIIQDSSSIRSVQADLLHFYEEKIRPHLLSWVNKPMYDFDAWLSGVIDKQATGMDRVQSKPYFILNKGVMEALKGAVIPHRPSDMQGQARTPDNHASKHVRDFYEFLQTLQDSGMTWADLHTGNFMVRRGTGDFVIVDPGYFDTKSSSSSQSGSGFDPPSGS